MSQSIYITRRVSAVTQRQQRPEIRLPAAKSPRQFDDRYAFRHTSKMGQKATFRDYRYCVVADISRSGAKIVVEGEANIPAHFELAFADGAKWLLCELIWRRGKTAGVKFAR